MSQAADLVHRTNLLVKIVLGGAATLLVLLLVTFVIVPHQDMPEVVILFWGLFILIAGIIAGIAAAYLFMSRAQAADTAPPAAQPRTASPELEDLAIRLLDGDERRVVRALVEAKGEMLQRDLVRITTFSDAKVSRLLDRLQDRGLIVRERQGMTNRVRLTLHQT